MPCYLTVGSSVRNGSKADARVRKTQSSTRPSPQILFAFLQRPICALSSWMQSPRIRFTPVPLKARHDGWTAARQVRFIEMLAATRSIVEACRAVGMTRAGAYKLRDRPDATQFRRAWDAALRPDFERDRRRSPRALARLRRLERGQSKVDDVNETHAPSKFTGDGQPTSSALSTLQTYLAELRRQEQRLGSTQGE